MSSSGSWKYVRKLSAGMAAAMFTISVSQAPAATAYTAARMASEPPAQKFSTRVTPMMFEYELIDTGAFREDRYFDVFVEYAKADADDMLIRVRAVNRGPDAAPLRPGLRTLSG